MILDQDQVLTRVVNYWLQRGKGENVNIEVHQIILGSDQKYMAILVDSLGMKSTNLDFHVYGANEFAAIEALVEKIRNLPKSKIFPSSKTVTGHEV